MLVKTKWSTSYFLLISAFILANSVFVQKNKKVLPQEMFNFQIITFCECDKIIIN